MFMILWAYSEYGILGNCIIILAMIEVPTVRRCNILPFCA